MACWGRRPVSVTGDVPTVESLKGTRRVTHPHHTTRIVRGVDTVHWGRRRADRV